MQPVERDHPLGEDIPTTCHLPSQQLKKALRGRHRLDLTEVMAATATKLLPLLAVLDTVQTQANSESVFRTRRRKIQTHLAIAYTELQAERPRHQTLTHTFHILAELVREETRDISPDELKQAAKEVALATLKHAPALINVAHQARLLT
jgi:type VI protein secretion system component VasF